MPNMPLIINILLLSLMVRLKHNCNPSQNWMTVIRLHIGSAMTSRDFPPITHNSYCKMLTHWGRVMYTCVDNLTIIGSDNGLSSDYLNHAGILLIVPLGTSFSEILIKIHTFQFKKMYLKMTSAKWQPFCLGLNVLMCTGGGVLKTLTSS